MEINNIKVIISIIKNKKNGKIAPLGIDNIGVGGSVCSSMASYT